MKKLSNFAYLYMSQIVLYFPFSLLYSLKALLLTENLDSDSAIDITPYASVDVEFFFYPRSMENGEDFWLQYNDGSGWVTVATYARGTDFENNAFYTSTVNLDSGVFNFVNNAQFRFRNDASGNSDWIYIDAVTISGNDQANRSPRDPRPVYVGPGRSAPLETFALSLEDDDMFSLYPNPATTILNVETFGATVDEIYIYSALGMEVKRLKTLEPGNIINVSELATGTYFVRFVSGEDIITRKFIKE